MKSKFILGLLSAILMIAFAAPAAALATGTAILPWAIGLGVTSMIPKTVPGALNMALDVEIWKPWIVEQLFAGNEFLNYARNADESVLQGKVVHIPNAGVASDVQRNRSVLPAKVTIRSDRDVVYALDEFTSDPRLIKNAEKILSYDKMSSAMGQDMRNVKDLVAKWMIFKWLTYSTSNGDTAVLNQIATTGAAASPYLPDQTSNRKKFALDNLKEAQSRMDENSVPDEGRCALFSARALDQLTSQLTTTDYKDFSRVYDPVKGIVGELFGFKIFKRATVARFDASNPKLVKEPGAANAATDNDVALCWHPDYVERAIGTVEIFEDLRNPLMYGDIYSLLINAGGRRVDSNGVGVVAIVQST